MSLIESIRGCQIFDSRGTPPLKWTSRSSTAPWEAQPFRQALGYDAIVLYKRDRCENAPPPCACIVNFHGQPKPCDFTTGWVAEAVRATS